jgi:hypothetical protein
MWQRGNRTGVVAYDRDLHHIYGVSDTLSAQKSQVETVRFLSDAERATSMMIFISLSVRYFINEGDNTNTVG